ncbi:hypothetical protein COV04_03250 [Candidatus Uhrbacteria bacterium CG10_big_fil_rev_8_21_14_0_10_48_11]|uniref:DUF3048 domain-containing protein n=1 Tax=Candidatus Uhrbacteria bacterium CG10_big_fil_rev_8_21_14_0_10_48_11 TaxID=1975037 RepID=A0A2M8LE71_9BACT|nr:MAG: hypothetical protein COV04_03250 [Candidatus Uhrbacteria bacterium CG10_big_fil_rev_8_21_14_0_10_48_11]
MVENKTIEIVKAFCRQNIWIILALVVLTLNIILVYVNFLAPSSPPPVVPAVPEPVVVEQAPEGMVRSSLIGEYIAEMSAARRPFAVMLDDFPSARPESGVSNADWVWETLVEGGVTRVMAVFQSADSATIGPVRSAREYFLPLASELNAIYVHSGGSPAALQQLATTKMLTNADEFANGSAFYRRANLVAPHNLFTSIEKLTTLSLAKKWNTPAEVSARQFSDDVPAGGEAAKTATIDFSLPSYRVTWRWDDVHGRYLRFVGGVEATDRENANKVGAATVVVELTKVAPAPRVNVPAAVSVSTVGEGDAWFFRNGKAFTGRWQKKSASSATAFLDANGQPFTFARGSVWVEVASASRKNVVSFSAE